MALYRWLCYNRCLPLCNLLIKMNKLLIPILITCILLVGCSCPNQCNDNNSCTDDFCSAVTDYKCEHRQIAPCDGNSVCEIGEFGKSSDCPSCDDNNDCTIDEYNYDSKDCKHTNIKDCKEKEYYITLTESQSNKQLLVNGETNLPDNSIIGIGMDKDLLDGHVRIIAQDSVSVNNGKFSSTLGPFTKYVETGKYEISATFTPVSQKSQNVLDEIGGKKAPNLRGDDVEFTEFGFNVLTTEIFTNWVNNDQKPESNNVLVTQQEEDAGVTDSDLINWCNDGCRMMANAEGWSTYEYNSCVSACLRG